MVVILASKSTFSVWKNYKFPGINVQLDLNSWNGFFQYFLRVSYECRNVYKGKSLALDLGLEYNRKVADFFTDTQARNEISQE